MKGISAILLSIFISLSSLCFADSVNINTADAQTLSTLKGVGASKAEAIIKHREENGAFKSKESLADVKGIGEKTVEINLDSIVVEEVN